MTGVAAVTAVSLTNLKPTPQAVRDRDLRQTPPAKGPACRTLPFPIALPVPVVGAVITVTAAVICHDLVTLKPGAAAYTAAIYTFLKRLRLERHLNRRADSRTHTSAEYAPASP